MKRGYERLDRKTRFQLIAIILLIVLILATAIIALLGKGKNPVISSDEIPGLTSAVSYDSAADSKYEDLYAKALVPYKDVIIPESKTTDKNYLKETLFVGDSNTEAMAAFGHISLQNTRAVSGMGIHSVTGSRCIWFVGYDEPVTIPYAVSLLRPRRIIINYGTNNVGGYTTDEFIRIYRRAIAAIQKAYPYADIIVESVLPVAKVRNYPSITMQEKQLQRILS